jgi:hypothetical protein
VIGTILQDKQDPNFFGIVIKGLLNGSFLISWVDQGLQPTPWITTWKRESILNAVGFNVIKPSPVMVAFHDVK